MSVLTLAQAMVIAAITVLFLAAVGTIRYRLTADSLEVVVLFVVVRRIPLDEIEDVHRRGAFVHESWSGPRIWNAVTLRRRRGLLRHVIITPDDPDAFVQELERRLRERRAAAGAPDLRPR